MNGTTGVQPTLELTTANNGNYPYPVYFGNNGNYGANYNGNYGARGRDMRYRGHDYLDRINGEYNRYEENRERYGAGKESDEAFHFMTNSLKDFVRYLFEKAETPQQKQMLTESLQNSMR